LLLIFRLEIETEETVIYIFYASEYSGASLLAFFSPRVLFAHHMADNSIFFNMVPNQYYILASTAIFYYDFALTFPQEIKHVWSSKFSLVNMLLLAQRYNTAIGYAPILWLTFRLIL